MKRLERGGICARAKVAMGRGARKITTQNELQPTLLSSKCFVNEAHEGQSDSKSDSEDGQEENGDEENDDENGDEENDDEITNNDDGVLAGAELEGCVEERGSSELSDMIEISDSESEQTDMITTNHPFLVQLRDHLKSRHGKGRSERETLQISSQVAKYLKFAGSDFDPRILYDVEKLDMYMEDSGRNPVSCSARVGVRLPPA